MAWQRCAAAADVPADAPLAVQMGAESVALYLIDGRFYATSNVCTHEHAWLSDGYLDGDCIECPLHAAVFHVPTGEVRGGPVSEGIRTFALRVDDGEVYIEMAAAGDLEAR